MDRKIRWGLVSAGRIAHTFARDIKYVEHAEITAVAARSLTNAQQFAAQYDIDKAYQGYEALFVDPDVDAVYISTPHTFHYQHTKQAIIAGKSVLCEKPFTVNSAQAEELTKLAKDNNVYLMEAMWTWFLPAIRTAKTWIDDGRIGDIVQFDADFGYPISFDPNLREYNRELAGGCLLEMGIYPVALARYILEGLPSKMEVLSRFAKNGVEDDVKVLLNYDTSPPVSASIATSFKARLPNFAFITGTKGYIVIPDFFRASECMLYHLDEKIEHYVDQRKGSGFEFEIQAVCDDILTDKLESDIVSHQATIDFQRHMDAIKSQF